MKCIHTIINNVVTNTFIAFVNQNYSPDNHIFYVIRGWSQTTIKTQRAKNVFLISNLGNIINGFKLLLDINKSDKILIHGLFTPYLVAILFFQPWVLKKCNWLIWGGDLNPFNSDKRSVGPNIVEYMRSKIIPKFGSITSIDGDYKIAKSFYKVKAPLKRAYYPFNIKIELINEILVNDIPDKSNNDKPINIVIGNSSSDSNNHFEIIDLITKFKDENVRIYALLAYGDKQYAQAVVEYGKKFFREKFISITDFLPFKEYVQFFNKMDIIIFNHERQQGCGNLLLALYLKKKVYLNNKSSLWSFLIDDLKIMAEQTSDIRKQNYSDFISLNKIIAKQNSKLVYNLLQEDSMVKQWNDLLN